MTIVGFNHEASVHLSACKKTDPKKIAKAVESIQAGGFTNLNAGLMLGYKESLKNFDSERSNRVILLSDGISNRGVLDIEQIADESKAFNKKGIDLSTIGLGHNFNEKLLRKLSDAGRGLIHFVGDSKDIKKTFIEELDSLLVPAARKVRLAIDCRKGKSEIEFYGYQPKSKNRVTKFKLDNLNCGATQVVMAKVKNFEKQQTVNISLSFDDAVTGKSVEIEKAIRFDRETAGERILADKNVRKNYSIARVAYSIQQCLEYAENKNYKKAAKKLKKGIEFAREHFSKGDDRDVDRMIKIAKDYQQKIAKTIEIMTHVKDD